MRTTIDLPADLHTIAGQLAHNQRVTDAYLVALAKSKSARLVSFDRGLAALRPELVSLVPVR